MKRLEIKSGDVVEVVYTYKDIDHLMRHFSKLQYRGWVGVLHVSDNVFIVRYRRYRF